MSEAYLEGLFPKLGFIIMQRADSGELVHELTEATAAVRFLRFSADGTRLLAVSEDWTVHAHPLRIEDLVALARTRVQRELSADERRKYLHQP